MAAKAELDVLRATLQELVGEFNAAGTLSLTLKTIHGADMILGLGNGLLVRWENPYVNTLSESKLEVTLWNGFPPFPYACPLARQPVRKLDTRQFNLDMLPNREPCWVERNDDNHRMYKTRDLASHLLRYYMENGRRRSS